MAFTSLSSLSLLETDFITDLSRNDGNQWAVNDNVPQNEMTQAPNHHYGFDIKNLLDCGPNDTDLNVEAPKYHSILNNMCQETHTNHNNGYYPSSVVNTVAPRPYINTKSFYNGTVSSFATTNVADHVKTLNQRVNSIYTKTINSGMKRQKRVRTVFTTEQMIHLEKEYASSKYLERHRRSELSSTLRLSERTIKVWFQNRRMKEKKDKAEEMEENEATSMNLSPEYTPQAPLDVSEGHNLLKLQAVLQGRDWYAEQNNYVPMSAMSTEMSPPLQNMVTYPTYSAYNNLENFNLQINREEVNGQTLLLENGYNGEQDESSSSENIEHISKTCLSDYDLELTWELINELSD